MSDLPKTDEYERVLLDALWSDGRYHVDPRRVVLAANAMHDELVAALAERDRRRCRTCDHQLAGGNCYGDAIAIVERAEQAEAGRDENIGTSKDAPR